MPGKYREITGYDEINTFPRNDCLMNFEPGSNFLKQVLSHRDFKDNDNVINITDNVSWQSIILDVCKANVIHIGSMYNYKLTLLYLFEDFVAHSSEFDKCLHVGTSEEYTCETCQHTFDRDENAGINMIIKGLTAIMQ